MTEYRPSRNYAKEYSFISSEDRRNEEKIERERDEKLRNMNNEELRMQEDYGGVSGIAARFEIKRRSKWGKFTHTLGVTFLLAWGIFWIGLFVFEFWKIYWTQGL